MSDYLIHLTVILSAYVILVYSVNLLVGDGGLLAFCGAVFCGAGAYAAALAGIGRAAPPYVSTLAFAGTGGLEVSLLVSMLSGVVAGLVTAAVTLRFRGDVFVLATLAMQTFVVSLFDNADSMTRGPAGLYGLASPVLAGHPIDLSDFAVVAVVLAATVAAGFNKLRQCRFGVQLRALRDDEAAAGALGVMPNQTYLGAFAIAGAAGGLAGGLYSNRAAYIDPNTFGVSESILLVTALLLGGRGTKFGPLLGATVLVLTPEAFRYVGMNLDQAAALRNALLGFVLIILTFLRPGGLAGPLRQ